MARTNGSDDLATVLSKREMAAMEIMKELMAAWAQSGNAVPDTKHMAFLAAAAVDALFDELSA